MATARISLHKANYDLNQKGQPHRPIWIIDIEGKEILADSFSICGRSWSGGGNGTKLTSGSVAWIECDEKDLILANPQEIK